MRRALAAVTAAVVLLGVAHPSFTTAKSWRRLKVQNTQHHKVARPVRDMRRGSFGDGFDGRIMESRRHAYMHGEGRSLKSTRDPQCNLPAENPCTLNTTAIGMVESGSATYYDEDCEAGIQGCYTDGVRECRTCYMSTEIYMLATNATEANRPDWAMCPCCVPTTLADSHVDIEVMNFNYTIFGISESACTDAPTQAPAPTGPTTAPAPTVAAPLSPAPTNAPTPAAVATLAPSAAETAETLAPEAASRGLDTPGPSVTGTPAVVVSTPAPSVPLSVTATPVPSGGAASGATTENLDTGDSDDGLSTGAKIGIGAGAAVAVIIVGAAGFGIMKASGRA